jgi:hypothetical protein
MSVYDELRRLIELERMRPEGVELPELSVNQMPSIYGDPLTGAQGQLGGQPLDDPMTYFAQAGQQAPGGPRGRVGQALNQKLSQPLPNRSTMMDNAQGFMRGFMQVYGMTGGGGEGGFAGIGDTGGMEGGMMGAGGMGMGGGGGGGSPFADIGGSGGGAMSGPMPVTEVSPPPSYGGIPDVGGAEGGMTGMGDLLGQASPPPDSGPLTGANPAGVSPTEQSDWREVIDRVIHGESPAKYFARKMGATPAQQAAADAIAKTVMTKRRKGQAGVNSGRIAALIASM